MFLVCAMLFTDYRKKISAGIPLLAVLIVMMTIKTIVITYPYGLTIKKQYEKLNEWLNQENLPCGYCFSQNQRPVEIFSQHKNSIYPIHYDEDTGYYKVASDRTYTWNQHKPEGIDRFYIVVDPTKDVDQMNLEHSQPFLDTCREKVKFYDLTFYIFNIEDWNNVLLE